MPVSSRSSAAQASLSSKLSWQGTFSPGCASKAELED